MSAAGAAALGTSFWRLETHDALASTSDLCRVRAEAGEPAGLAVLARRQEAGRGRDARVWQSPAGNLYLSVLLRPRQSVRAIGAWALLTGVALAEALAVCLPTDAAPTLKWPNDVLVGGAKIAGILIECTADDAGALEWLVIGMGVNLATAPSLADRATVAVADHAAPPPPEAFAPALLARLGHWADVLAADGIAPIRAAWLRRGPAPGAAVGFRLGGQRIEGAFAGLGEDGALRLRTVEGLRSFVAGEVIG